MKNTKTKFLNLQNPYRILQRIIIYLLVILSVLLIGCSDNNITGEVVNSDSDFVKIPLSDLSSQAKFYDYNVDGVNVKYFAVLGSDGVPRTAFDACDICGGYKGYTQKGSDIVCNQCGRSFKIDGLGSENKGYGCWPSYLPHEVKGDNLIINAEDIKAGAHRFA